MFFLPPLAYLVGRPSVMGLESRFMSQSHRDSHLHRPWPAPIPTSSRGATGLQGATSFSPLPCSALTSTRHVRECVRGMR